VALISLAVMLIAVVKTGQGKKEDPLTFTEFLNKVQAGEIKDVTITGDEVHGDYSNRNQGLATTIPLNYPDLYKTLNEKNVNVTMKPTNSSGWVSILVNASPFIVVLAFWIFMMRQMQSGGKKPRRSCRRLSNSFASRRSFRSWAGGFPRACC
jgi:cell division protease FtsH